MRDEEGVNNGYDMIRVGWKYVYINCNKNNRGCNMINSGNSK